MRENCDECGQAVGAHTPAQPASRALRRKVRTATCSCGRSFESIDPDDAEAQVAVHITAAMVCPSGRHEGSALRAGNGS